MKNETKEKASCIRLLIFGAVRMHYLVFERTISE